MGKPIANDLFLTKLQQLYQGTRAWGTVRVQYKRMFEERQKHKRSLSKQRQADRVEDCKDAKKEFNMIVKAATPKRKICTAVTPENATSFEQKVSGVMTAAIFKGVLERQERDKKDKKKKGGKVKEESKTAGGKGNKRDAPGKIKKCRKERRKDLAKQSKKLNLLKQKTARMAAKAGSAPAAPSQ